MSGSGTEVPPGTGTGGQGTEVPPGTGGQGTEVVEQQIGIEGQQGTEQQSLTAKADTIVGVFLGISNQLSSILKSGGDDTEVPPELGDQRTEVVEQQTGMDGQQSLIPKTVTIVNVVSEMTNQLTPLLKVCDYLKKENTGLKKSLKTAQRQARKLHNLLRKKDNEVSEALKKLEKEKDKDKDISRAVKKLDEAIAMLNTKFEEQKKMLEIMFGTKELHPVPIPSLPLTRTIGMIGFFYGFRGVDVCLVAALNRQPWQIWATARRRGFHSVRDVDRRVALVL
ncbi:hypothetical protein GQ457_14G024090 [Hibiscus cannabinus]